MEMKLVKLNKMRHIYTMAYLSAIKRSEVLIYTITWMNPENTVLSEEADHKNTPTYYLYNLYIYLHIKLQFIYIYI